MSGPAALRALFRSSTLGCRYCSPGWTSPAIRVPRIVPRSISRAFSQGPLLQEKRYTEQHEWIELEGNGLDATIGITEYAAKALGEVVFVELPSIDNQVTEGETIGAVESVKSASDIMSPVAGTIVAVNSALEESPKVINESPERDGWIAKIQVANKSDLNDLMNAEEYQATLQEE